MLQAQTRTRRPPGAAARRAASTVSLLLLPSVLAAVLFVTIRSPLKDDIAWLLYVARLWVDGRELYVDLIEVNPPLIVWISALPVSLAGWIGVDARFVAMPFFIALVLGCAWWGANLLRANGGIFADRLPVFAAVGSVLLVIAAGDVGQREHLLVAAFLPYLVLFARRLGGGGAPVVTLVAAGTLAAVGCALKPRYAAAFAVLECLAATRGLRPWRAMPLAAGATLLAYAGLVAVLCPAYLRQAVPLALALYGATDVPFQTLLGDSALLIGGLGVAAAPLWPRRRELAAHGLMLTLVAFAASSTAVCLFDGKDWYYHRLPATIATVLALLLWTVSESARHGRPVRLPLYASAIAMAAFGLDAAQRLEPAVRAAVEPRLTVEAHLERTIRAEHARTYVAFSEWIALGFPVVNETGVTWTSRFDSMWALKGEAWRARLDPAAAKAWPIRQWVSRDFIAGCPDVAVVDRRGPTDYVALLSAADPAFARAWSRYRLIEAFDGLAVYRRGTGGCQTVWIANEAGTARDVR